MKTVLVGALTLLLGLFLGGLGPRAELRRTRKELAQAKEEAARSAGAGLPAALGLAGLAAARDRAQAEARQRVPRFNPPEKSETPEPVAGDREPRSPSGERDGDGRRRRFRMFGDGDGFAAAKAAADLRAAQFRAAFVAEARLDPQRQNALDGTINTMNAEFAKAAGEIAESVAAKGKRVTPRDMADVGVKLLDIYRRADDSLQRRARRIGAGSPGQDQLRPPHPDRHGSVSQAGRDDGGCGGGHAGAGSVSAAPGFARDVAIVARFELAESVRSKLIVVMVLLFVGAGSLGAWGFTEVLGKIEENAARVTGAPTARRPGAVVRRLRDSTSYRDMVRFFIRDDAKADYFASMPPMVVFFGWSALTFLPWLVLFTSAESIAGDVSSRAIRYSVLRTGRLPFALGKAAGQAVLVVGVTVLSAARLLPGGLGLPRRFRDRRAPPPGCISHLPRDPPLSLTFSRLGHVRLDAHRQRQPGPDRFPGRERWPLPSCTACPILDGPPPDRSWPRSGSWSATSRRLDTTRVSPTRPGALSWTTWRSAWPWLRVYFSVGFAVLRRRDL